MKNMDHFLAPDQGGIHPRPGGDQGGGQAPY